MSGVIFPGQGSQHTGMGQFLYNEFSIAKQLFEEASDTLKIDFKKMCFDGSDAELALTENTQPCLLLVSTATFQVLTSLVETRIQGSAGHSIGEYAALVCAGVIPFSDAIAAVRKRGEFMQSAVPVGQGGMAAVMGLTAEQVQETCSWAKETSGIGGVLEPANYNAPGQIVISGSAKMIEWVAANFKAEILSEPPKRVKFIPLKVSAPFHCSLMQPAENNMRSVLEAIDFEKPNSPIYQNVSAQAETDPATIRENIIRQISSSVRWIECVEAMQKDQIHTLVECGSGKVLNGLVKKISSDITVLNINSIEDLKAAETTLKNTAREI